MTTINAGIYCRISLDVTGQGLGVQRQREDCMKRLNDRGWNLHKVYVDNDLSASKANVKRPEYDQMIADLEAGVINAVVVYDLDRLTRRPIELEMFMDLADRKKVGLANVSGDVDLSTSSGRMMARIKGAVARQEADRIGERVARRARQRAEAGVPMKGRWRYFGYDGDFNPISEEQAMICEAYARMIAGESSASICKDWNAQGKTTVTGVMWRRSTLLLTLDKPFYAGIVTYKGARLDNVKGIWVPAVDVATYERYMATREGRRSGEVPNFSQRHLLSGIAVCGRCGSKMRTCGPKLECLKEGGAACGRVARKREPIEQMVEELIVAYMERERVESASAAPAEDHGAEIVKLNAKIAEYQEAHEGGSLDLQDYIRFVKPLRDEVKALLAREAERGDPFQPEAQSVREKWQRASMSQKRAMIVRRISSVVVKPTPPEQRGLHGFNRDLIDVMWA